MMGMGDGGNRFHLYEDVQFDKYSFNRIVSAVIFMIGSYALVMALKSVCFLTLESFLPGLSLSANTKFYIDFVVSMSLFLMVLYFTIRRARNYQPNARDRVELIVSENEIIISGPRSVTIPNKNLREVDYFATHLGFRDKFGVLHRIPVHYRFEKMSGFSASELMERALLGRVRVFIIQNQLKVGFPISNWPLLSRVPRELLSW